MSMEADNSLQKVQTTPPDMEAVAWREKVARIIDPRVFEVALPLTPRGEERRLEAFELADRIIQALAVIPTYGGGND